MDSRLIYIATERMKHKISWTRPTVDSEWTYFGRGSEVNRNIVNESIKNHFTENALYVCYTRPQSFEADKSNIMNLVKGLLGKEDFFVWDTKFTKVIEFNKIGVMRKGEADS